MGRLFDYSALALDELFRNLAKKQSDVAAALRGDLDVRVSILLGILLDLLLGHLPFRDIGLVSNEEDHGILASRLADEVQPLVDSIQRRFEADVDHYEAGICVADVAGDERPEALLSGGVPELQPQRLPFNLHCFGKEVDAHRRLNTQKCTLAVN